MGNRSNRFLIGFARFVGFCLILPVIAGAFGLAVSPLVAQIFEWF